MPWTAAGFRTKHAHGLSMAQAKVAAEVANKALESGRSEKDAVIAGIMAGKKAGKGK
jgi:uncharacterized protein YdaT